MKPIQKIHSCNFDTVAILVHSKIWKERNSRLFNNFGVEEVFGNIRGEI
jgi:hypothetical protein